MTWPFPMQSAHPMVVHFPIALLLTAVVLDMAALVARRPALHRIALWNLVLGTLAAGAAVVSGLRAEEAAKHSFEIWQVMERHEQLGIVTLSLGAFVSAFRLWKRDRLSPRWRLLTIALLLAMLGSLTYGAHLGGRLVYEFGVGGRFGEPTASTQPLSAR